MSANPKGAKSRVHTRHHRRYRSSGIERYMLEARTDVLYEGVKSVEQLRKRFRDFAADDKIWSIIQTIHDNVQNGNKTFDALEKRCKEIARRPIQ